jgi:DNA recombination protein RmuC
LSFNLDTLLAAVHKHINSASNTLETLQTTRTKAMERKLRGVETLEIGVDQVVSPTMMLDDD